MDLAKHIQIAGSNHWTSNCCMETIVFIKLIELKLCFDSRKFKALQKDNVSYRNL